MNINIIFIYVALGFSIIALLYSIVTGESLLANVTYTTAGRVLHGGLIVLLVWFMYDARKIFTPIDKRRNEREDS